jgi:hypothetical protein
MIIRKLCFPQLNDILQLEKLLYIDVNVIFEIQSKASVRVYTYQLFHPVVPW